MSYYPPKGKELKALRQIRGRVSKIENGMSNLHLLTTSIMCDSGAGDDTYSWKISTDHALRGIRVNGTGRTVSLATIMLAVSRIRAEHGILTVKVEKEIKKLEQLLTQIERIIEPFGFCPSCLGGRGRRVLIGSVYRWEDCCFCDGRGILL